MRVDFPALDSLRAIAAVAVVATHTAFWSGAYARPFWGDLLSRLDVGVALFFVLSGFLLSRAWFERHAAESPPPSAARYLRRRALRIVPVYVVSAVGALLVLPGNDDRPLSTWLSTLTLTTVYVDDSLPDGLTQMWSLATEVAFYLALPALMWLLLRRGDGRRCLTPWLVCGLAALCLVNVAWTLDLSVRLDGGGTMLRLWLPGYLTWFAVGILVAAAEVDLRRGAVGGLTAVATVLRRLGRSPGSCWVVAGALLLVAATPVGGPTDLAPGDPATALTKNLLYAAVAAMVLLPAVFARPDGLFLRSFSWPPLRHLGHVSYGIFCTHLVVLELVGRWRGMELFAGRGLERFALTMLVTLAVAELLYRLVERPVLARREPGPSARTTSAPRATATRS